MIYNLCKEVKDIPAAYDIDAVVAQLETDGKNTDVCISKKRAIEIIKAGGIDG